MARPLAEYFKTVISSDIHSYGFGGTRDFLFADRRDSCDWIITNPPFRLALQFIDTALSVAEIGVAMLVRTAFLEGIERHHMLFSKRPPQKIAQFVERVPMVKGRYDPDAATATSYCWLVWQSRSPLYAGAPPAFYWIPRCRTKLVRPEDLK